MRLIMVVIHDLSAVLAKKDLECWSSASLLVCKFALGTSVVATYYPDPKVVQAMFAAMVFEVSAPSDAWMWQPNFGDEGTRFYAIETMTISALQV